MYDRSPKFNFFKLKISWYKAVKNRFYLGNKKPVEVKTSRKLLKKIGKIGSAHTASSKVHRFQSKSAKYTANKNKFSLKTLVTRIKILQIRSFDQTLP